MTKLTSEYGFTGNEIREDYITERKKAGVVRTLCLFLLLVISTISYAQRGDMIQPGGLYALSGKAVQKGEEWLKVDTVLQEIDSVDVDSVRVDSIKLEIDSVVDVDSVEQEIDSVGVDSVKQERMEKAVVALRTNMLYDAALIPNIGIEVKLGKGFTIGADWFGTWLFSDKKHIYWQCYGGYLTARYYWGKAAAEQPFTGHHVGIYGTALTYDVEFGGKGYQAAKFGFGGGVEYGYSLRVARSLCIDFDLGLGYQGGEYKVYMPTDDGTGHYVWMSTHRRNWWGPTKAEISLKWLISAKEKKNKREHSDISTERDIEISTDSIAEPETKGTETEGIHSSVCSAATSPVSGEECTEGAETLLLRQGEYPQGEGVENPLDSIAKPELTPAEAEGQSAEPEASPTEGEKGGGR